jgi:hypothetical protein
MLRQAFLKSVAGVGVFVFLMVCTAPACVRSPFAPPPICERFWQGDAVGLVDVARIEEKGHSRQVILHIVEVYRGAVPSDLTMSDPRTDCGVNFPERRRYLAWLSRTKSGKWTGYADLGDSATEDLKYAESVKTAPSTGRIFGTLDKPRRNLFVPTSTRPQELPDRSGVTIVAVSQSRQYAATINRDLTFDLSTLPEGNYHVYVEGLPSNLAVDSQDLQVHGGGCNELTLFTESSASVSGRVLVAKELPRFGLVYLVDLASKEDPHFSRWVPTNPKTGAFEFKHVDPGKYVLGFAIGLSPTLDSPYASRYFPSAIDKVNASVLEVHPGQELKGIEFNLGNQVARRHVRVRVEWADGSPAVNATAYLRDAHDPYTSVADKQTPTNTNGEALLEGFIDTDYDVAANAVCKSKSISRRVETKVISASPKDAFVALTVKGPKCQLVDWQLTQDAEQ